MNKTPINIAFGKRLVDLRKTTGLSQEAFAFKCGLDRTYIGIIERGEKSPTLNTIEKVAIALNITIKDLFDGI